MVVHSAALPGLGPKTDEKPRSDRDVESRAHQMRGADGEPFPPFSVLCLLAAPWSLRVCGICILEEPHDPKSCHVRFLVIPRTLLFLLALLSLPSFANDGMRISRHQADRIDSCLGELTLVGKSTDSLSRARIEASVRTIRAQLEPRWTRPREPMGMDSARFLKLSEQVRTSFPYREQRKFLRLATIDSRFTVAQVDQLLRLVTHGSDQAEAANLLLPRIVDLENVADLRDVLWTVQGGKALDRFIDSVASQPSNHSEPSPRRSRRSAP